MGKYFRPSFTASEVEAIVEILKTVAKGSNEHLSRNAIFFLGKFLKPEKAKYEVKELMPEPESTFDY